MRRKNKKRTNQRKEYTTTNRNKEFQSIKTLRRNGNDAKAFAEIIRYVENYPDDPYGHYEYGKILLRKNDMKGAKREFELVVSVESNIRHSSLVALARIHAFEGNKELARDYYHEALSCNPYNEVRAHLSLAQLEREDKNYYGALNILYSALEFFEQGINDPSCSKCDVESEIAKVYVTMGKNEEAEKILRTIVPENRKQQRDIAMKIGLLYRVKGENFKAIAALKEARDTKEKDKQYYLATMELVRVYKQMGNISEELFYLEELDRDERFFNGNVPKMLGMVRLMRKDYKGAKESFAKGLTANEFESRNICAFYYSNLQILEGDELGAEKTLKDVLAINDMPDYVNCTKLIKLLYDHGKYREAEKYLSEIRTQELSVDEQANLRKLEILLNKKQGKKIPERESYSYLEKQFIDFDASEAISFIEHRHSSSNPEYSSFSSQIDIAKLYEDIQVFLTEDNKLVAHVLLEEYEITYPNAGYWDDEIYNVIRVVTIPGTTQIVTMYPNEESLLPTKGEFRRAQEKEKSKVNDRISKFNAKYAKYTAQQ